MAISRNARRRKSRDALGRKLNREALVILRDAKQALVRDNLTNGKREASFGVSGIYSGAARPMGVKRVHKPTVGAANRGETVSGVVVLRPAHIRDWNR